MGGRVFQSAAREEYEREREIKICGEFKSCPRRINQYLHMICHVNILVLTGTWALICDILIVFVGVCERVCVCECVYRARDSKQLLMCGCVSIYATASEPPLKHRFLMSDCTSFIMKTLRFN